MKGNNIISLPNDTIAILCEVLKGPNDSFFIQPLEVAIGKLDCFGVNFTCADNGESYDSLLEYIDTLEEGKTYYCFEKNIQELRELYSQGVIASEENLDNYVAICHLSNICKGFYIVEKDENGESHLVEKVTANFIDDNYSMTPSEETLNYSSETEFTTAPAVIAQPQKKINPLKDRIDIEDFEKYLNDRIIGNEETISNIATTIAMNLSAKDPRDVENLLSIGPTGSGKSQTAKDIAEYLSIPVVFGDCTQLSAAGYVGKDVEDLLREVYIASNSDLDIANRSIIILDEIDKLKSCGLEMKEAAQDALLKVVEGHNYTIELDKTGRTAQLNTLGMTIIGCGAFSQIFDDRVNDANKNIIGFSISDDKRLKADDPRLLATVTDEELKKFGFKAEFIPRFQNRNVYKALDKDGLKDALTRSQNSALLAKIRRYLEQFNTEIITDDSFIDAVVEEAFKLQCGGRSLNRICAQAFKKADRELLAMDPVKKKVLRVTGETIKNNKSFELK